MTLPSSIKGYLAKVLQWLLTEEVKIKTAVITPSTLAVEVKSEEQKMANIFLNIEKGLEVGAKDALHWLAVADKVVVGAEKLVVSPAVQASLATVFGDIAKDLEDVSSVATNPLNISLDVQTFNDLKATWPAVKVFLASIGVKL